MHRVRNVANKHVRARLLKRQQQKLNKFPHEVLKNFFSVFEPSQCKGVLLYDKNCKQHKVTQVQADQLIKTSSTWSVACYILCREKNGKYKIEEEIIDVLTECKHSEIKDQIADAHWEWFTNYEWPDTVMTLAWIAGSYGNVPTLDQAYTIFDDMGIWSNLVPLWEAEELNI